MPIETMNDIVEQLADKVGIYGAHDEDDDAACQGLHPCRCCWTSDLIDRINCAVRTEQALERGRSE